MSAISKFQLNTNAEFPIIQSNGKVFIPAEEYVLKDNTVPASQDYYAFPVIAESVIGSGDTVHLLYGRGDSHSVQGANGGSWYAKSLDALQTLATDVHLTTDPVPADWGVGSIAKTQTGRILLDYQQYSGEISGGVVKYIRYSDDDGATWSAQVRFTSDYTNGLIDGPSRPIQYDGEMLKAFYVNTIPTNAYFPVVYLYTNNGTTRTQIGVIYPTGYGFEEPCLGTFSNSWLIAMLRNDVISPAGVYVAYSPNGSKWSYGKLSFPSVGKSPIIISANDTALSVGRNALKRDGTATATDNLRKKNTIFATSPDKFFSCDYYPLDTRDGGMVYADGFWNTASSKAVSIHGVEKGASNSGLEGSDLIVRYYNEVNESDVASAISVISNGYDSHSIANINLAYRAGFTLPSQSTLDAWDDFIAYMVAQGYLTRFDFLKIVEFNNASCQDFGCLDIKDPRKFQATRYKATGALGYPNYSALGFKPNKTNNYLNLNWDASVHASNYTLNSASIFVSVSEAPTAGVQVGSYKTTGGTVLSQIGLTDGFFILNSGVPSALTIPVKTGDFAVNRSASNAVQYYRNGASIGSAVTASVSIPAGEWVAGARSTESQPNGNWVYDQFSDGRIEKIMAGGSFSAGEVADIRTHWVTYKTAIGL